MVSAWAIMGRHNYKCCQEGNKAQSYIIDDVRGFGRLDLDGLNFSAGATAKSTSESAYKFHRGKELSRTSSSEENNDDVIL